MFRPIKIGEEPPYARLFQQIQNNSICIEFYHGCLANRPEALGFVRGLIAGKTKRVITFGDTRNRWRFLLLFLGIC